MYKEIIENFSDIAIAKSSKCKKNKKSYLISAIFAGSFIGLGVLLSSTIGGLLSESNNPFARIIMGLSFSVALISVVFSGTELFTGNNFVMSIGRLNKKVETSDLISVWIFSWIGNFLGAILLSSLFVLTGLVDEGSVMEFFSKVALNKANLAPLALFTRAIICNFIVCLAILLANNTKNDAAKIIIIILCLFAFVTTGFEHSVANMTAFSVAIFAKNIHSITIIQAIKALIIATLGNIVGGGLLMGLGVFAMKE